MWRDDEPAMYPRPTGNTTTVFGAANMVRHTLVTSLALAAFVTPLSICRGQEAYQVRAAHPAAVHRGRAGTGPAVRWPAGRGLRGRQAARRRGRPAGRHPVHHQSLVDPRRPDELRPGLPRRAGARPRRPALCRRHHQAMGRRQSHLQPRGQPLRLPRHRLRLDLRRADARAAGAVRRRPRLVAAVLHRRAANPAQVGPLGIQPDLGPDPSEHHEQPRCDHAEAAHRPGDCRRRHELRGRREDLPRLLEPARAGRVHPGVQPDGRRLVGILRPRRLWSGHGHPLRLPCLADRHGHRPVQAVEALGLSGGIAALGGLHDDAPQRPHRLDRRRRRFPPRRVRPRRADAPRRALAMVLRPGPGVAAGTLAARGLLRSRDSRHTAGATAAGLSVPRGRARVHAQRLERSECDLGVLRLRTAIRRPRAGRRRPLPDLPNAGRWSRARADRATTIRTTTPAAR